MSDFFNNTFSERDPKQDHCVFAFTQWSDLPKFAENQNYEKLKKIENVDNLLLVQKMRSLCTFTSMMVPHTKISEKIHNLQHFTICVWDQILDHCASLLLLKKENLDFKTNFEISPLKLTQPLLLNTYPQQILRSVLLDYYSNCYSKCSLDFAKNQKSPSKSG